MNPKTAADGESIPASAAEALTERPGDESTILRRRTLRNVMSNWAGFAAEVAITLALTPFLVSRLGDESYGVWILIGSLAGYMLMLDFGLRGSVGRFVAFYRGRDDQEGILRTSNTALVVLAGVGFVVFAVLSLSAAGLHLIFEIDPEHLPEARAALLIIALQFGIGLAFSAFDAVLWGHERFDLINLTDGLAAMAKGALAATAVAFGYGLVGMAWTALLITVLRGLGRAFLCRMATPSFRLSWHYVQFSTIREIGPYGFWNFLCSMASAARQHLNPILVGATIGPAIVTPYSIASRLVNYGNLLLFTTVNVLTPTMTAVFARNDVSRRQSLVFRSGRICAAYALYFVALSILIGKSFLTFWIPEHSWAASILWILVLGEWLPMAVHPYSVAVLALAQQRPIAWRGMAECVVGMGLAVILGPRFGLTGMAIGFAVAAGWFRGVFMLRYGGRHYGPSPSRYVHEVIVPILLHGAVPVALFAAIVYWRTPETLMELVVYVAAFTAAFGLVIARCIPDLREFGKTMKAIFVKTAA